MSSSPEFDLFSEFCQQQLCTDRLNHNQYTYLICSWSENQPERYLEALQELNLKNAFQSYQNQLTQQSQEQEYQIGMIKDLVSETEINLRQAIAELEPIQQEIDSHQGNLNNWQKRHQMFPENPKYKAEFEEVQATVDQLSSKLLKLQQEIERFENSIRLWNSELIELQR
jgi:DNA repair ATPase RecN